MEFVMRNSVLLVIVGLVVLVVAGCGRSSAPAAGGASAPSPVAGKFVLSDEPADAKTVIEVREAAKDGDEVTIVGRIGGDVEPFVKDRAAFVIVDPTRKACSDIPGDNCPTPWDYCCDSDGLDKAKATIKFVDDQGQTVATDARKLLGVKELQRVTIRGQAKRDEAGNLTVLASGIYVKP
jgi:hypothetical protein